MSDADDGAATRAAAARAVAGVLQGQSLDAALPAAQAGLAAADQSLAAALAYGVVRDYRRLATIADGLLRRPPPRPVLALILVGFHQLIAMRIPPHAAVHATVAATGPLKKPQHRGLVNAVLRRFQRESRDRIAALSDDPGVQQSHPDWLVARLRQDWPADWPALLTANNQPAPMTLRVNARRTTRDAYRDRLHAAGMVAHAHPYAAEALMLDTPVGVASLPGFGDGDVSVQDAAAQLAARLLAIEPGMRVLDACSAPGGKAAHCRELFDCELVALDSDPNRLERVAETLDRLGLREGATLQVADATLADDWWDGRPFDRILIDAPCTGTGVIRRHPDIKWLRRETDSAALAVRQRALLDALWPLLAPGGRLVYATCSVLAIEGGEVVAGFYKDTPAARPVPMTEDWGEPAGAGRRIAPGEAGMDGFFYAVIERQR
ncbi:16S rRNA (cytosine(967)-C(5))-methyltransferase RsmB [Salinisphaera sp. P385]|uniref:16S rRNA (cytosine(967)-C(5))-methyltransferase n=1 Tax=Spectribacter acetivorans TaxID=3075603 RepID=A0ABU3BAP3_9GAMM|nr:16S rRNA (cytosine(967)-C(5))-methyltransferase RsmB [Salinisphaera sp. P385]MDT0618902.1 16S rRNA (cytosine(967)-C(5))-methyltransferase RsmB [Salinisphaera sp. P385]